MTTYTIHTIGTVVMLTANTPSPAGAPDKEHYLLSAGEARSIAAELVEAAATAEKATTKAKTERVTKLQSEIDAKKGEIAALKSELDGLAPAGAATPSNSLKV